MRRILCLGEVMIRLSTRPGRLIQQGGEYFASAGGAEANVAVALARLGWDARVATMFPDNPLGTLALRELAARGVATGHIARGPGRMGLYFLSAGAGCQPPAITYDRADSAFALADPARFDWPAMLDHVDWLHLSGITPALGDGPERIARDAIAAASRRGVRISFDCNYRPALWLGREDRAPATLRPFVEAADLLFAGHRDIALLLGQPVAGEGEERDAAAAALALATFPRLRWIASTMREVVGADTHRLAARVDGRDGAHLTAPVAVEGIIDRIGSGDAFAAGVIHAIDEGAAAAAATGLALAALNHAVWGDFSEAGPAEIDHFRAGRRDVLR